MYNISNNMEPEYLTELVVIVVCSGLTSLSTIFRSYHDGVCFSAHFYSAASMKYHAPDT